MTPVDQDRSSLLLVCQFLILRGMQLLRLFVLLLVIGLPAASAVEPQILGWHIEGEKRAAIVYPPSVQEKRAKAPLIFVFHGHGDNAWFATEQFPFQQLWPEAIVVFPQGLPRASSTDPRGERRGWQHEPGEFNDRDLKLFDAMLRTVRAKFRVDDQRIYAAGFSNGGFFDYILWAKRDKVFAAFAPCAAALRTPVPVATPKPVFIVAGEQDKHVSYPEQHQNIATLRRINGCTGEGRAWGDPRAMRYESPNCAPVVAFVHAGGHAVPHAATVLITEFFQEHSSRP